MIRIVEPSAEVVYPQVARWPELLALCEECGRVSHRSEGRIKPGSAENFIRKVAVKMGHESILEHASITVRFVGSRAMSHQLVRHRIAAFTQESMRYCDYSNAGNHDALSIIVPPSIIEASAHDLKTTLVLLDDTKGMRRGDPLRVFVAGAIRAYDRYLGLRGSGIPAEDARFILPTATATVVYTTFNLRQWLHVFKMRCDPHAQWEIRAIMGQVRDLFAEHLPVLLEAS